MAGVELLAVFWKAWGIQALVLLSFALQVTLLLLADIRRCKDSGVLKAVVWSAYLLADTTAIYALGHMSVTSSSPEHELMAFWAPFLLMHLGGQDNMAAYAIEDNRLWMRHLQTFAVQVLGAAYVLYESSILRRPTLLRPAAILVCLVGVLKYGERVWALKRGSDCTSSSLSATSYKDFRREVPDTSSAPPVKYRDTEGLLFTAYTLLDVPKQLFSGPTRYVKIDNDFYRYDGEEMSQVVEMQLSLMYDLLYTKAAVAHTWYGFCIRVISPLATVAASLLFLFHTTSSNKHGYNRVDVSATYVLLAGAVVLEITSVLRAMFSSWTCALLLRRRWYKLAHALQCIPRLVRSTMHTRYWSGSMGQHNFFDVCARGRNNWSSKIARWIGQEDWWGTMVYSWSIPVSAEINKLVVEQVTSSTSGGLQLRRGWEEDVFHITNSRGRAALRSMGMERELDWSVLLELDESILVWHIATNVYLTWYREEQAKTNPVDAARSPVAKANLTAKKNLAKATEVLSNYMFFLLAARPYMLPYPVSRQRYVQLCYDVVTHANYSSAEDLLRSIREQRDAFSTAPPGFRRNRTFTKGSQLGTNLILTADDNLLRMISQLWVEMLCYTAYRCNETSHSKHLSDGGEIMTSVALLMLYMFSSV